MAAENSERNRVPKGEKSGEKVPHSDLFGPGVTDRHEGRIAGDYDAEAATEEEAGTAQQYRDGEDELLGDEGGGRTERSHPAGKRR